MRIKQSNTKQQQQQRYEDREGVGGDRKWEPHARHQQKGSMNIQNIHMTTGTNTCKAQHKEGPHYITSLDQNEISVHTYIR